MNEIKDFTLIKNEFFNLYYQFLKKNVIDNDVISMGNLALFVDYSAQRIKWNEYKKTINQYLLFGDKNDLYLFLANHLVQIAKKMEISDNLTHKIEKMSKQYDKGELKYFDIILDPYDFPEWFKRIMVYIPLRTKEQVFQYCEEKISEIYGEDLLKEKGNQFSLMYLIERLLKQEKSIQLLIELDDKIRGKDLNELSWFLSKTIFSFSYPEQTRYKLAEEKMHTLNLLGIYQKQYLKKNLTTFNLFSKTMITKF